MKLIRSLWIVYFLNFHLPYSERIWPWKLQKTQPWLGETAVACLVSNVLKAVLHGKSGLFDGRAVGSRDPSPYRGSLTSLLLMDPWKLSLLWNFTFNYAGQWVNQNLKCLLHYRPYNDTLALPLKVKGCLEPSSWCPWHAQANSITSSRRFWLQIADLALQSEGATL